MTQFKKVSQKFLVKKALVAFRNMVRNYDASVTNEEYFSIVDAITDHPTGLMLVEDICDSKDLEAMKHVRSRTGRLDLSKPLRDIFRVLWNNASTRVKSMAILMAICDKAIRDIGRIERNDIAHKRFAAVRRAFGLSSLESEIMVVAYASTHTCFCWPTQLLPDEQPVLYAMATNRSFDDVAPLLSTNSRLRKCGVLNDDLEFNEKRFGGFIRGVESGFEKESPALLV